MPPEPIPIDRVLNLWAHGRTVTQIVAAVRRKDGSRFTAGGITTIITQAREYGDPRAILKRRVNHGTKSA